MNSSLGVWMLAAGAAALVLLLLFGAPTAERDLAPELDGAIEMDAGETADAASSYWQPVTAEAPAATSMVAPAAAVVSTPAPCPSCGSTVVHTPAVAPAMVGGCGYPAQPCGKPACPCPKGRVTPTVPVAEPPVGTLVGGCGRPSTACGATPCAPLAWSCYDVCTDPCRVVKPGINRNMPLCVDECSFIQLRSTVPHPICEQVRFEWSASKGWFLDPTASDPLFFAPTTHFCDGEDIWITLIVTDESGAQYSDVISLHVRDLP